MIGVAIVTYNSAEVIARCLEACGGYRVVVVDNASIDSTVLIARNTPGVLVISNPSNRGFAAAVNQAVEALRTEIVVVLNPDVTLETRLEPLETALADSTVGIAGGLLLSEQGNPQDGFNVRSFPTAATLAFESLGINALWPGNPVNRRYRQTVSANVPVEIDQPAGAFLAFRRDVWTNIGGFDETFHPIWFEDVDFCLRARRQGYRILHVPAARGRHLGGHSASRIPWQDRQLHWYRSLLAYTWKHFGVFSRCSVCLAVLVGCLLRAGGGLILHPGRRPVSVYSRVVWVALRSLLRGPVRACDGRGSTEASEDCGAPRETGSTAVEKKAIIRPV